MRQKDLVALDSSLTQQCYDVLRAEIISGELKPGQKLKTGPLKERFDVGQSPIREALSRLVACGLVDTEENKGFRVAPISETDIRDIYRTFTAIENMALAWALECGDTTWEADIVAALHKLSLIENGKTVASYAVWSEYNYNFHYALIAGCNSPTLLELRNYIYMKFDRYCQISYQAIKEELCFNYAAHKELVDVVLQRNVQKACALMTYHINEPLEMVISKLKESKLL